MKYYTCLSVFKFSWDQVASTFWNRYPNPHSTHVLTEDTVTRHLENAKLYSRRLITKTNHMPKWGERFVLGPRHVCVMEESIVDPEQQTLTTYTRNIGLTRIMTVEEKCVYRPSKDHHGWTECERHAWVASSFYGFIYALQAFGIERYKKNSQKTAKGFEHILQKMFIPDVIPEQTPLLTKVMSNKDKLKEKVEEKAHIAQENLEKAKKAKALAKTGIVTN